MNSAQQTRFLKFLRNVQRSRTDRKLGGVCGGFAAHSDIPAWVYRAAFIILLPLGIGALGYFALWVSMPEEPLPHYAARPVNVEVDPAGAD